MTLALRTRLTVSYTAIFGLLLAAVSLASYRVLARQLDADATANLTQLTYGLHGYLRFEGDTPAIVFDRSDADQAAFVHEATRYYQIYDASTGRLLVQSEALEPLGLRFTPAEVRAFRDQPRLHDIRTDYGRIRISNSVISPATGQSYLLQVGASLDAIDSALDRLLQLLMWSVLIGLFAAVLAGRWTAAVALGPLSRFAAAARTIDVTNLRQRLPVLGAGDELDDVAQSFNETLGRLEHAVGEMRQFSTALAHELRTPLAALRGEIEMSLLQQRSGEEYERGLASQLEELDKLKRLIDQLLTLARAEAGEIPLEHDPVDLGELGASLVDQVEPVARARAIDLRCERSDAVVVDGDAEWLGRLVLNLVDNAIKFTPEGGRVMVRVSREDDTARLEVSDTGVGIPPDAMPHIFERFFRADPARSPAAAGVGVGLSLVKWIIDRHNGRIEVETQLGKGSTFTVRVPVARR